jgi:hypothetical protein
MCGLVSKSLTIQRTVLRVRHARNVLLSVRSVGDHLRIAIGEEWSGDQRVRASHTVLAVLMTVQVTRQYGGLVKLWNCTMCAHE